MSDETPEEVPGLPDSESAKGSEAAEDVVAEAADAGAADPAPRIRRRTVPAPVRRKDLEAEEAQELDPVADADAEAAQPAGRIRRRTVPAPVRRKDLEARELDPEADDADIVALEGEFSDEESEAAVEAMATAARTRTSRAPVKKGTATRRRSETRREATDPYTASNPVEFVQQSANELKQVVWPTRQELWGYFLAVLVFVVFFIAFIGLLDMIFGWGLLTLLGGA